MLVTARSFTRGMTLVELLVTLTILAIGLSMAAPTFTNFQRNAELTSTANVLLSSLNTARSEAMKHGIKATLVPTDEADWAKGWTVFVDVARNAKPADEANIRVATQAALPNYMAVTPSPGLASITFDASGYAIGAAGFVQIQRTDVQAAQALSETRKVIVAASGRVKTCRPATTDDPNC